MNFSSTFDYSEISTSIYRKCTELCIQPSKLISTGEGKCLNKCYREKETETPLGIYKDYALI